jgi:polar amino acid transport system permease protein
LIDSYAEITSVLFEGLWITVKVLIGSVIIGYLIAFVAGFGRIAKNGLVRKFTGVYVEVFRGTSLMVQLFWFYFAFAGLFGIQVNAYWAGVLAIALNYGAYMSEVVRGSILAVSKGQTEAAIALNMSGFQQMRLIVLPQAVRMMLPEFSNYLIQMLKATSLVSLIGLADITYQGMIFRSSNLDMATAVFSFMLIFYFILAIPFILLSRWAERFSSKGVANE